MTAIVLIVSAAYYLIAVAYIVLTYNKYKICPEFIWVALQLVMFYGISGKVNYSNKSDVKLVFLYLIALICFVLASTLTNRIHAPGRQFIKESSLSNYNVRYAYFTVILAVSAAICAWFFFSAGGNVFLNSIRAMITGDDYSTKYARMGMLRVFGTGYVYQLRIAIIPTLTLYYIFVNKNTAFSYILAVLAIIFMLGTGQRGGFVSFMCICVLSVYYWQIGKNRYTEKKQTGFLRIYIIIAVIALSLFALTTVMNGRVSSGGSVVAAILKRIFSDNQSTAVNSFRYVNREPCQFGYDWYIMIRKLLPGAPSYTSVATRVFALMNGGSTAGTAPPCIWTSAYYNFGVPGVVALSALLGFAAARLHRRYTTVACDELGTIIYAGKSFLLAYWLVDGPVTLLNNGFVALCLLELVMNMLAFRIRIKIKRKNE